MDRNTLNRFLGYREQPTISSWAKEQMEKDGIDTSRYKTYADIHQEKVEEKEPPVKKAPAPRKRTTASRARKTPVNK